MKFFKQNFEWMVLLSGLFLMALMDPYTASASFCVFDLVGISYCPGDGLGHSISWLARGDLEESWQANMMGIPAVLVLSGRIASIWYKKIKNKHLTEEDYG